MCGQQGSNRHLENSVDFLPNPLDYEFWSLLVDDAHYRVYSGT